MENRTPRTSGRPVQGGESNHPYNTTLWSLSQAIDAYLLPLIVLVDQVFREVVA